MKLRSNFVWKLTLTLFAFLLHQMHSKAQDHVVPDSISQTNRVGLENLLQGQVSGLLVKNWSGTAGLQSIINLRGLALSASDPSTMPLFLINGVPIVSSPSNVTGINPLSYYSVDQIERIEVWKDIDQLSAWGLQAANGAINIIIKEGAKGPLHVRAKLNGGVDYLSGFSEQKDRFYNFNPLARKEVYVSQSLIQEQHVSIDGGGDYGSYLFGMNNFMASGAMKDANYQRQNLFVNAKYKIADPFTIQFYSNLALAKREGRFTGQYQRALTQDVIPNEEFFMDDNKNVGMFSSMDLVYQFTPHLKLRSLAGLSYESAGRDLYIPSNLLSGQVIAGSQTERRQVLSVNTSLNYLHKFSDDFELDLSLGNQVLTADFRQTSVDGMKPLASGGSDYVKIVTGYNANQTNAFSDAEKEKLLSFYGILDWNYKGRFLINMVGRADGSSLYQKKWGFYPAISLTYDLKEDLGFPVRLKTGYGKTGQRVATERYRGELESLGDYFDGNKLGISQLYAPFEDARSVDVKQFDAKIDLQLLDRLHVQLGYFNKSYSNFSYARYLPNILGDNYQFEVGAGLKLQGLEFDAGMNWIHREQFSWSSRANLASFQNHVSSLPENIQHTSLVYLSALSKNDEIQSILGYENGKPIVLGASQPKLFGGFSNDLRVGSFGLGILLNYATGGKAILESYESQYIAEELDKSFPMNTDETPYYQIYDLGEGKKKYRGIQTIQNTDFLRVSRVALSYTLGDYINKWKIKQTKVSLRGENLFTFSKYKGFNPDENISGIRRSDLMHTGTILPSSIVLGLNLTF